MNRPDHSQIERQIQTLETEINQTQPLQQLNSDQSPTLNSLYNQFLSWFTQLPPGGKVLVAVFGLIFGLSLLSTFLKLISLTISLVVLTVILYFAYRLLIVPQSSEDTSKHNHQ